MTRAGARPVGVPGLRPCYTYPVRRPRGVFGGLGQDISFSDTLFRSAPLARGLLALPYEPLYRLAVSQADWVRFAASGTKRRRAWAAFGQPGGAYEMASSAPFQELTLGAVPRSPLVPRLETWMLDGSLPAGGAADDYCAVLEPRWRPGDLELVQLMAATTLEFAAELRRTEAQADAKVVDDQVPAACVFWRREPYDFSLSVTARVSGGQLNGLRFWAVFWNDDEQRGWRWVYKPLEVLAPGIIVTDVDQLSPGSEHSGRLMTVLWEQFEALRRTLQHKASADCFSEAVRVSLLP
jgi:hypothetical protein